MSASVFLLLMLMEFKRSRIATKQSSPQAAEHKSELKDEQVKAELCAAIEPELEK